MAALKFGFLSTFLLLVTCVAVTITKVQAATEYNRYLAHIFQKYGNGGSMSFEGLEHLMYNLGLGQLEFEPSHTIDEHKPKGRANGDNVNEDAITSYMEQQTNKLMSDDEDIQITQDTTAKQQSTDKAHEHSHDANDESQKTPDNTVIVEFKEMHDPKHRHPRENDATFDGPPLPANVCLSPKSLLRLVIDHDDLHKRKLYKTYSSSSDALTTAQEKVDVNHHDHDLEEEYNHFVNYVRLTPVTFMKLCPALLAQIDQQVCLQPAPLRHSENPKEMIWNAWIYASASIFILSACGLLGILLVPLMKTVAYQEILNFLIAVAVGTLSGDALMHLLPHALVNEHAKPEAQSHDDHHDDHDQAHSHDTTAVWICACAFFTAVLMYIIENLLPLLRGGTGTDQGHGHGHSHHHHHHNHHNHTNNNNTKQIVATNGSNPTGGENNAELPAPDLKDVRELNIMLNEAKTDEKKPSRPLTPVAFMVIIGDGLHNLTDGLAIGAAFASAPVTGLATAFAVLCHELPHELGDFALLLQTGVSIRRAIYLNIVSSVLSFVGMAIGLLIAGLHTNMTQWIYAGTAGSFLYIALADLVPAMAAESKNNLKTSMIQVLGVLVGGFIMLAIAINEDHLERLFK